MEYDKLDSAISIRLPSEAVKALNKKAKKARRKLRDYLRLLLIDDAEKRD